MTSGLTLVFIQVEVVAISPSTSNLVRVEQEPDHRHLVVRLVGDVGHHHHALLLDVWIDSRCEWIRDGGLLCDEPPDRDDGERHHRRRQSPGPARAIARSTPG